MRGSDRRGFVRAAAGARGRQAEELKMKRIEWVNTVTNARRYDPEKVKRLDEYLTRVIRSRGMRDILTCTILLKA